MRDHLFDISAECPYGLEQRAVYRQAPCPPLSGELFARLLASGFRRNGNTIYTMACPDCRGCVPIRLPVRQFKANRNQRRVWRANQDIEVCRGPLQVNEEKLALCEKFLARRYPGQGSEYGPEPGSGRAVDYYAGFFLNSIVESFEVAYYLKEQLLGLAVVDLAAGALNAVYFYFDPDQARRSLGTLNILYLVQLCRELELEDLYLGYLIEKVPAMSYKARFNPHQRLEADGNWCQPGS